MKLVSLLNTCILVVLFFTPLAKVKADTIDSLHGKMFDKISIDLAGGATLCDYLYSNTNYSNVTQIYPSSIYSLRNPVSETAELNIKVPIKKSRFLVNTGIGFVQRNINTLFNKSYYLPNATYATPNLYPPRLQSITYRNDYLSMLLGGGYTFLEFKHFVLEAFTGIMPAFNLYQKEVETTNQESTVTTTSGFPNLPKDHFVNHLLVPLYFNVNSFLKLNQYIAIGFSRGIFYDTRLPFPEIIIKNRISYSSYFIIRYTL